MQVRKLIPLIISFFALPFLVKSQVTTSSITGVVLSEKNEPLVGATIEALDQATGNRYSTTARNGGRFLMPNVAPGGPYTITATYAGLQTYKRTDVMVPLGDKFDITIQLAANVQQLESVIVSGTRSNYVKTGAGTNISHRQMVTIPNSTRSITGLTKLNPQSNGNSFAGMNYRYNNITIDGSLFNNNFGRSGDGFVPGGAAPAISLDAIDQIQVNIAPFDVRQAGFVGGGVNAVSRRGTNNIYASVYGYYRNQSFNGKKVKDQTVDNPDRSTKIYGASIGAPIIKNKLFIFVNAEKEMSTRPGQIWKARTADNASDPQVTPVLASDLQTLSDFLKAQYNYNTGPWEGYNFEVDNYKLLGRIDWNISSRHRLTMRYTQSSTDDDDQVNNSSTIGSSFGNGRRGSPNSGMAYKNSNFKNNTIVKSGVFEINSDFTKKISNQFLISYTDNEPKRITPGDMPFVDIMKDPNNVYISFGSDLFSYKNYIVDKALNAANNVTLNLDRHTVTFGASYDHMEFQNSFTSGSGGGYYRYSSLQSFLDQEAPVVFAVSYDPSNPDGIKVPSAKFNQLGLYAQDVWSIGRNFKLTYGLRLDRPSYPYKPDKNPALEAVSFKDENGNEEHFDVSEFPKARFLVSPRVGFTWDPYNDKSVIIRGGTGIFTGRIPFIWLVNQVGDNGIVRAQYQATGAELAAIRYNTDRTTYIPTNPPPVGTSIPNGSSYSATVRNFKMPQVWRTNLAMEKKLNNTTTLSLEGIYTKMINNVYYRNANLGDQKGTLGGAADHRPIYTTRLNSAVNRMMVLDNTNKGMSFAVTPMIRKSFAKNWEAMLAYTYTAAFDVAIGSSDQAASGWTSNNIYGNPNKPELGYSNFSVPHRIVAYASYKIEYLKGHMATTIGLYYSGSGQQRFHYRYGGDVNSDGATQDIIYIPKDPSEIKFVEGYKSGGVTYTAQQQSDAFFAFVKNDKYLSKHQGQYMERYGAVLPWTHQVDLRLLQDFKLKTGSKTHTLQVSADLTNLLNFINKEWGYNYLMTYGSFQDQALLGLPSASNNTGGENFNQANPKFTFNPSGPTKDFQPNYSIFSTWGLTLGVRYIFN
ncbi:MAG: TonB-dependent receptor [Chitinophagaceae bacterium]|nr:TonB-dependent receptor [Chitinophagaceae bacterium]